MTTTQTYAKDLSRDFSKDKDDKNPMGNKDNENDDTYSKGMRKGRDEGSSVFRNMAEDATDMASSAVNQTKRKVGSYLHDIEDEVTAKPMQSVALAFASGALISLLLSRR